MNRIPSPDEIRGNIEDLRAGQRAVERAMATGWLPARLGEPEVRRLAARLAWWQSRLAVAERRARAADRPATEATA